MPKIFAKSVLLVEPHFILMPTTYQVSSPQPYVPIQNQQFDHLELSITQNQFAGVEEEPGNLSISFIGCAFKKLVLNNSELIAFPDISIGFTSCYIGEIEVKEVISDNIQMAFLSCFLDGKIDNNVLQSVSLQNCYIPSALFLMRLQRLQISFTSKTLNRKRWIGLLRKMGLTSIKKLREQRQNYHAHQCQEIRFTTDFDHTANALGFIFSLSLFYGEEQKDKKTHIEKGYFTGLSLDGTASGTIKIDRVRTDAFYLRNFSPQEEATFFDLRPMAPYGSDTKFEIHQSDLDSAWFDTIAFGQYAGLTVYR